MTLPVSPAPFTGQGGQFTFNPDNTLLGTYAVRVTYYSPVNSGSIATTFLVDVYPETAYTHPQPSTTCMPDIYPLTFGNYPGITVLDGDYDGSANFVVCGWTTSTTKNAKTSSY